MLFSRHRGGPRYDAIEPDEILIDAANLPAYDTSRLEGRIEQPFHVTTFNRFFIFLAALVLVFVGRLIWLQILNYESLAGRAEANRLNQSIVIAERGLITDRNGVALAENVPGTEPELTKRMYPLGPAAAQLVGYVSYPKKDANGHWFQNTTTGISGVEEEFNTTLQGTNGIKISETDASGSIVSGSVVRDPHTGKNVALSIDSGLQQTLYDAIAHRSETSGWRGGAGAIMDIHTGELLALVSYPSFDPTVMSEGSPQEQIAGYLADARSPFLDRAVSGVYTPGSVVKPFVAIAALEEDIINPDKKILSTGSISIPNPYDQKHPTIFRDWKAHGWVDMREAIAVSSDVYFYEVGGGFEDQRGLGITRIEEYMKKFGFGAPTNVALPNEGDGVIPSPEWKAANFDGDPWVLGDTYHTAIGQYGFQTTLLQLVRGVAAIANGGTLVTPRIIHGAGREEYPTNMSPDNLQIVREGMRKGVTGGTAQALSVYGLSVAAKTGTAEVGVRKESANSLVIGFFPYENPHYAFAVVMERAKAGTPEGAPSVMRGILEWIVANKPELAG